MKTNFKTQPAIETPVGRVFAPNTISQKDGYYLSYNTRDWGTYGYEILKRYARITYTFNGQVSVHCFVDMENGNIHKAAGWRGPVRNNIRGNILDADPLAGVMYCGAVYIKKC